MKFCRSNYHKHNGQGRKIRYEGKALIKEQEEEMFNSIMEDYKEDQVLLKDLDLQHGIWFICEEIIPVTDLYLDCWDDYPYNY